MSVLSALVLILLSRSVHPALAAAADLPPAPEISSPEDSTAWRNDPAPFSVSWSLPEGVTDVATALNQMVAYDPTASEGAISSKTFQISEDGVWYLHVRLKNAAGWGATAHVRLALDTVPPAPFELKVSPALITDVPTPTVSYESSDDLSGLWGYEIRVDDGEAFQTAERSYAFGALSPGRHVLRVDAVDHAGNRATASEEITLLPIASPTLSPIFGGIYAGEGGFETGGIAERGTRLTVELRRQSGELIGTALAVPNESGIWNAKFDQKLVEGSYGVSVTAMDFRGAQSLPVRAAFVVSQRPVVVFLGKSLSRWWFDGVVLGLVAFGFLAGWEARNRKKRACGWRVSVARQDLNSAFDQIQEDLVALKQREPDEPIGKRLRQRIRRFRQYILDNTEGRDD